MTAKEKANKLVNKMLSKNPNIQDGISKIDTIQANLCALVAVDEIIETFPKQWNGFEYESCDEYWQEVKQELLKL